MSNILTASEAEALTADKQDIYAQALEAKSQGEADRLAKRAMDIQKQLDADLNERRRTGFDEARAKARDVVAGSSRASYATRGSGPSNEEIRTFLTPGSPTTDMWVKPQRDAQMGPASELRVTPYLTTTGNVPGGDHFFVPEMYSHVIQGMLAASGVLESDPTLLVTSHLRPIQIPVLTGDAAATAGTEGSPATDANTTGGAVTLGGFRYDGKFTVSQELIASSDYDISALLASFATRSLANKTAAALALGNGTTAPAGLFYASAVKVGVTAASVTTVTSDEMLACVKAIPKGYRKTSKIVVSDVLHTMMLSWKNDDGDYVLRSIDGGGYQFAGLPVFCEPQADQSGIGSAEIHAVMGDFAAGYVVRTSPMFLRRSDADPLNPEITWAIWEDAKVVDSNALVSLQMK